MCYFDLNENKGLNKTLIYDKYDLTFTSCLFSNKTTGSNYSLKICTENSLRLKLSEDEQANDMIAFISV